MPETWPRIQLPGNGFGQNGSGWNFGTPGAIAGCPIGGGGWWAAAGPARPATTSASRSTFNDPIIGFLHANGFFFRNDRTPERRVVKNGGNNTSNRERCWRTPAPFICNLSPTRCAG